MTTNPFDSIDARLRAIEAKLDSIQQTPQAVATERKHYSPKEAAQRLGVAAITIYRGVESGAIPCKKVGTRILIPGSYVDR